MKKILLISSQWAPKDQTGLGFSSAQHRKYFKENGYDLKSVSLNNNNTDYNLEIKSKFYFILNIRKIFKNIKNIIKSSKPDFIVVESLQSVISELFLFYGFVSNQKTILISHGISILPLRINIKSIFKFFVNLIYFPFLIIILKKIDLLFTLKKDNYDLRHLDTILFSFLNKKKLIKKFNNFSRFEEIDQILENNKDKDYFLCIGYLNDIKNQKQIIQIAKKNRKLNFRLIYSSYNQKYLSMLNKEILRNKFDNIKLINAQDTKLEREIKNCTAVINTSITEVQPLSILEGFSFGKIYLSNDIKNLFHLKCGINNKNLNQLIFNLKSLHDNKSFKKELEESVKEYFKINFSNTTNLKNFNINEI